MHIAAVYSLPTKHYLQTQYEITEEDTRESAVEVADALQSKGHLVSLIPLQADNLEIIDDIRADLIFNLIEWTGPDLAAGIAGTRQIEKRGLPFTGATSTNYARMADKIIHKQDLKRIGSPTPAWQVFRTGLEHPKNLPYPLLVKPSLEHCSIGLDSTSIVHNELELRPIVRRQLATFHQPILAEEYIVGQEYQITLLETKAGLQVLPPAEVYFKSKVPEQQFLSYSSRWDEDHPDYNQSGVRIAMLNSKLKTKISIICRHTFTTLKYRDYARFDLRVRGSNVYILEANCNPGLGDSDDYGMTLSYKAVGMTFADFVEEIIKSCLRRFNVITGNI